MLVKFFDQKAAVTQNPCDNLIPQEIMCTDGTTSDALEFTDAMTEFNGRLATCYRCRCCCKDGGT